MEIIEEEIITIKQKVKINWKYVTDFTNSKSRKEAANKLGVSRQTIEQWIENNMSIKLYEKYFGELNDTN